MVAKCGGCAGKSVLVSLLRYPWHPANDTNPNRPNRHDRTTSLGKFVPPSVGYAAIRCDFHAHTMELLQLRGRPGLHHACESFLLVRIPDINPSPFSYLSLCRIVKSMNLFQVSHVRAYGGSLIGWTMGAFVYKTLRPDIIALSRRRTLTSQVLRNERGKSLYLTFGTSEVRSMHLPMTL